MMNNYNPFSLEGKTILVTGASSGIGRATAVECSKMGAKLVITGRNESRLKETFDALEGEGNLMIQADLSTEEGIDKIANESPVLDGIVFSAGVSSRIPLKMIRERDIEQTMKVNFNSPVLLQRMLLKKKKVANDASIVFIASRAPFAPAIGNGIYAASKGALIAYAKVLGLELADKGIRVNCVCPAIVWTDMVKADAEKSGADFDSVAQKYPLKRLGKPEDVANLVIYLLSNASGWMTGSCIDITGGGEFTLQ